MDVAFGIMANFNFVSFIDSDTILIRNPLNFCDSQFTIRLFFSDFYLPTYRLRTIFCSIVLFDINNFFGLSDYDLAIVFGHYFSVSFFVYYISFRVNDSVLLYCDLLIAINFNVSSFVNMSVSFTIFFFSFFYKDLARLVFKSILSFLIGLITLNSDIRFVFMNKSILTTNSFDIILLACK